jgi:hypothetical protein
VLGPHSYRGAARGRPGEKGGRDTSTTIGPQPTGHRPERRRLVAEPLGDALQGLIIDEDRAEGLVSALEGLLGLEEELPGKAPVHDACSQMLIIFRHETTAEHTAKIEAEKGSKRP